MKKILIISMVILFAGILAGCQTSDRQAVSTVEAYLKALVEKNEASFTKLSCPAWQAQALLEYDAFGNVATTLKDLQCAASDVTSTSAIVKCSGSIEASYQNEMQSFSLSERNFQMVRSGGDWLVCGY